jgi:hypothetical protein
MEGTKVTVQMQSGKTYESVELKKMAPGKIAGTYVRLTIVADTGKEVTLWAKTVKEVSSTDGTVQLRYDAVSKTLAPTDPDKLAEIQRLAKAALHPAQTPKTHNTKPKPRRSKRGAPDADSPPVDPKEAEAKRLEIFKTTGVWMWPELTAEQQAAELAKRKEFIKKVSDTYPDLNLRTSETSYFLFVTNMPQAAAGMFTSYLDRMYQELSNAFAIPKGKNIFPGRAVIFAFANQQQFMAFEQKFYEGTNPVELTGICHQEGDGTVTIACFCHTTPQELAAVMVHETTHGFLHRYKSRQRVASWLNEGMADWVALTVTNDQSIRNKQQLSLTVMQRQRNMGGDFFTAEHIKGWQYGIASSMVNFLIRSNPKGFRNMIDDIKKGKEWRVALKAAYNVTPEELAQQFGMALRIPNLVP